MFMVSTAVLPSIYGAVQLDEWKIVFASSRGIHHVAAAPKNISKHSPHNLASHPTRSESSNV
jgi:hypothetical protein